MKGQVEPHLLSSGTRNFDDRRSRNGTDGTQCSWGLKLCCVGLADAAAEPVAEDANCIRSDGASNESSLKQKERNSALLDL